MIPETDSYLTIASPLFAGHFDYMWISPSEKFIVCTAIQKVEPLRIAPIAVHFKVTGPEAVEVTLAGYDKWVTHPLRQEGEILWWTINGQDVPWMYVPADNIPPWAHKSFARGRLKLQKDKESGQIHAPQGHPGGEEVG